MEVGYQSADDRKFSLLGALVPKVQVRSTRFIAGLIILGNLGLFLGWYYRAPVGGLIKRLVFNEIGSRVKALVRLGLDQSQKGFICVQDHIKAHPVRSLLIGSGTTVAAIGALVAGSLSIRYLWSTIDLGDEVFVVPSNSDEAKRVLEHFVKDSSEKELMPEEEMTLEAYQRVCSEFCASGERPEHNYQEWLGVCRDVLIPTVDLILKTKEGRERLETAVDGLKKKQPHKAAILEAVVATAMERETNQIKEKLEEFCELADDALEDPLLRDAWDGILVEKLKRLSPEIDRDAFLEPYIGRLAGPESRRQGLLASAIHDLEGEE